MNELEKLVAAYVGADDACGAIAAQDQISDADDARHAAAFATAHSAIRSIAAHGIRHPVDAAIIAELIQHVFIGAADGGSLPPRGIAEPLLSALSDAV